MKRFLTLALATVLMTAAAVAQAVTPLHPHSARLQNHGWADFLDDAHHSYPRSGRIHAYHVAASGYSSVHSDALAPTASRGAVEPVTAPSPHDAVNTVPEPGTLALLGIGIAGVAARMRRQSV